MCAREFPHTHSHAHTPTHAHRAFVLIGKHVIWSGCVFWELVAVCCCCCSCCNWCIAIFHQSLSPVLYSYMFRNWVWVGPAAILCFLAGALHFVPVSLSLKKQHQQQHHHQIGTSIIFREMHPAPCLEWSARNLCTLRIAQHTVKPNASNCYRWAGHINVFIMTIYSRLHPGTVKCVSVFLSHNIPGYAHTTRHDTHTHNA